MEYFSLFLVGVDEVVPLSVSVFLEIALSPSFCITKNVAE